MAGASGSALREESASAGWLFTLAACALTPLIILHPALFPAGSLLYVRDYVALPKMLFAGLCVGGGALLWALEVLRGGREVRYTRSALVGLAFVVWAFVATLLAGDTASAFVGEASRRMGLASFLVAAMIGWLVLQYVDGERALRELVRAMVAASGVVGALAILQALELVLPEPFGWASRASSTLGNPGLLGTYLAATLCLSAGLFLFEPGKTVWKYVAGAAFMLQLAALVLSFARAAWIGAFVGLAVIAFALLRGGARPKRAALIAIAGVVAVVAIAVAIGLSTGSGDADIRARFSLTQILRSERPEVYGTAVDAVADKPWTGWGPDAMRNLYWRYAPARALPGSPPWPLADDAHSLPLDLAVSFGIPGLLLAALWFGMSLRSPLGHLSDAKGSRLLGIALTAGAVGAAVSYLFAIGSIDMLIVLVVCTAAASAPYAASVRAAPVLRWVLAGAAVIFLAAYIYLAATMLPASYHHMKAVAAGGGEVALAEAQAALELDPWTLAHVRQAGYAAGMSASGGFDVTGAGFIDDYEAFGLVLDRVPYDIETSFAMLASYERDVAQDPLLLDDAVAFTERLFAYRDDLAGLHVYHGRVMLAGGRADLALSQARKAIELELDLGYADAYGLLARALEDLGMAEESAEAARIADELR